MGFSRIAVGGCCLCDLSEEFLPFIITPLKNSIMRGLIIKPFWMSKILSGEKSIEVRSCCHHSTGERVLLLISGGWCVGSATLGECFAFDCVSWQSLRLEHCVNLSYYQISARYKSPYGWKLLNVRWCVPYRYKHPKGAIIWVKNVIPL